MRKLLILLVLILIGPASWAQSNPGTGQWLHDIWKSNQRVWNRTSTDQTMDGAHALEYQGFVMGATAVMATANWIAIPASSTSGQIFAIVGEYIDDHPEEWNLPAVQLVYRALYAAWPGETASPWK
jgi:hypothetical protein